MENPCFWKSKTWIFHFFLRVSIKHMLGLSILQVVFLAGLSISQVPSENICLKSMNHCMDTYLAFLLAFLTLSTCLFLGGLKCLRCNHREQWWRSVVAHSNPGKSAVGTNISMATGTTSKRPVHEAESVSTTPASRCVQPPPSCMTMPAVLGGSQTGAQSHCVLGWLGEPPKTSSI